MYESYIQTIFILPFRLLCGLVSIMSRHFSVFLSYDDTLSIFGLVKCFYSFLRLFHMPPDTSLVLNSNKSKDGTALRSVYYNISVYCFVLTIRLEQQLSEDYVCLWFLQVFLCDLRIDPGKMILIFFSMFLFLLWFIYESMKMQTVDFLIWTFHYGFEFILRSHKMSIWKQAANNGWHFHNESFIWFLHCLVNICL